MTSKKPKQIFALLAALLPGDHIHHVAPTNRQTQSGLDRIEQVDAAQAKRNRKNAKRKELLRKTEGA